MIFNSTTLVRVGTFQNGLLFFALTINDSFNIALAFTGFLLIQEQFGDGTIIIPRLLLIEVTEIHGCSCLTYDGECIFGEAVYTKSAIANDDLVTYHDNTVTLSTGASYTNIDTFYYIDDNPRLYEFNGNKIINDYGAGTLFVAEDEMYAVFSQFGQANDIIQELSLNGNSCMHSSPLVNYHIL